VCACRLFRWTDALKKNLRLASVGAGPTYRNRGEAPLSFVGNVLCGSCTSQAFKIRNRAVTAPITKQETYEGMMEAPLTFAGLKK